MGAIIGIILMAFLLILFNFYRSKIGIYYTPSLGTGWAMVNIFSAKALDTYVPLWSIIWALSIGLNVWLLSTRKHNVGTKIFQMIISALNIGILFFIANGPNLFEFDRLGTDFIDLQPIVDYFTNNQSTIFYVIAVLSIIGLVTNIVKFIIRRVKAI